VLVILVIAAGVKLHCPVNYSQSNVTLVPVNRRQLVKIESNGIFVKRLLKEQSYSLIGVYLRMHNTRKSI